jgi:WD40 repeat protein
MADDKLKVDGKPLMDPAKAGASTPAPSTPPASRVPDPQPSTSAKLLKRHMLPTGCLCITPRADGRALYAACNDGVYELNLETGERKHLYDHESYASGVALLEPANTLISAGYDGTLVWYDLAGGKKIRAVKAHDFWCWQLAGSPDGKYVASATGQYLCGGPKYEPAPEREPSVKVFDTATGALVHAFPHLPPVQCVTLSADSRLVAAGNMMGEVRIWDLQSGKQVGSIQTDAFTSWGIIKNHHYLGGVFALRFLPDGEEILLAGMGPMEDPMAGNGRQLWHRYAWRSVNGSPARKVDETHPGSSGEGLMESLAIHPSGSYFVMTGRLRGGSWNTAFFSLKDGSLFHSFKTETRITRARFAADGKRLFLGGMKGQPAFKEGKIPDWGHVDVYELSG